MSLRLYTLAKQTKNKGYERNAYGNRKNRLIESD